MSWFPERRKLVTVTNFVNLFWKVFEGDHVDGWMDVDTGLRDGKEDKDLYLKITRVIPVVTVVGWDVFECEHEF